MNIQKLSMVFGAAALGLTLTLGAAADGGVQPQVKWKLATTLPTWLDVMGPNGKRVVDNIRRLSDGKFDIEIQDPGGFNVFDPVSEGSVDGAYTSSLYHSGKIPALAFFGVVPFGPDPAEYLAWLQYGGGNEIYRELYAEHNVVGFHCGLIVPEAGGWFTREIKSADDLNGLKIRFFGLGARVMKKMGASTQLLPGPKIYPAFERGEIDATEFSYPSIDVNMGFQKIARHYYFPGWHQQSSLLELIINKDKYEALPDSYKAMIEMACGEAKIHTMALSASKQAKAMLKLQAQGVNIHRWSPEFIAEMQAAWDEVVTEASADDPVFKRVHDSYAAFRKEYAIWKDHGYLR